MKEIGKLIELLNEYDPYIASDGEIRDNFWYFIYKGGSAIFPKEIGKLKIISKEYGFVKWLVENDKIDIEKVEKKFYNEICITDYGDKDRAYGKSDLVISVLSISDTPIEDLISYLK